ncbi:MAG: cell division protein FtsL [Deltaproteobacteria bacterium]|jgi:cell division protein FtsL|nr:cell division protein FtsL [Deltaproteobacteria bacterium]
MEPRIKTYKRKDLRSVKTEIRWKNAPLSRTKNIVPADRDKSKKEKRDEEKLKKLRECRDPQKQKLEPKPSDRLKFFTPWHFSVVLAGAVIAILALFALISISHGRNELGLEVSRLTEEQKKLVETNSRLKAKIEVLAVLEDLEIIARENLKLQTPQKGQIIVME